MSKMKKVSIMFTALIVLFVAIVLIVGILGNRKEAISCENLRVICEKHGYAFCEQLSIEPHLQKSAEIEFVEGITINYWAFDSEEDARKHYLQEKKKMKQNKDSKFDVVLDFGSNYSKYFSNGKENYQVIVRVSNTVIQSSCDIQDKAIVTNFMKEIKY